MPGDVVLCITGASGAAYGLRTLRALAEAGHGVHVVVSENARTVIREETGTDVGADDARIGDAVPPGSRVRRYSVHDVSAPIASGSFPVIGMAIVPCSVGTLGRIANGISSNLIERAADVTLKERRPLVLVPRETPLSVLHLRNMTALAEAGATILPAMPGFYHRPKSVEDMVDFVVARVLDRLGVAHGIGKRWGA
ncbi:MAG: UbiX family flavin prenyltransferase [Planctomycetales bacterium]|nr:UbiX family flavin prenyltransferase [Planctomycetales bacterium]